MMRQIKRRLICVDFDGVLHAYTSGWRGVATIPDKPVPGAMAWLVDIIDVVDVAIYSTRSASWRGRRAMRSWLEDYLAQYMWSRIPEANGARSNRAWEFVVHRARSIARRRVQWPKTKPPAWLTLDDRCMRFRGIFPTDQQLLSFRPWNIRFGDRQCSR